MKCSGNEKSVCQKPQTTVHSRIKAGGASGLPLAGICRQYSPEGMRRSRKEWIVSCLLHLLTLLLLLSPAAFPGLTEKGNLTGSLALSTSLSGGGGGPVGGSLFQPPSKKTAENSEKGKIVPGMALPDIRLPMQLDRISSSAPGSFFFPVTGRLGGGEGPGSGGLPLGPSIGYDSSGSSASGLSVLDGYSSDQELALVSEQGITPPEILYSERAHRTEEARRKGVTGVALVGAIIRRDGSVGDRVSMMPLGCGLDEAAMECVARNWRFAPARKDGQPVDYFVTLDVPFFP